MIWKEAADLCQGITSTSTSTLPASTVVETQIQSGEEVSQPMLLIGHLTKSPLASVQTYTEHITVPYVSTTTQIIAPSTSILTDFVTLSARTTTLTSSFTVPASTLYQSTTITSNFVTTLTSTIAPSTVTSYEVSTAPGTSMNSLPLRCHYEI